MEAEYTDTVSNANTSQAGLRSVSLEAAQHAVSLGEALRALQKDANFKLLIEEQYFKEHAEAQINNMARTRSDELGRKACLEEITSVSSLKYWLDSIATLASQAQAGIDEYHASLLENEKEQEGSDSFET